MEDQGRETRLEASRSTVAGFYIESLDRGAERPPVPPWLRVVAVVAKVAQQD